VLAHAYLREDHVLDDDLPVWVPIPALAEIQVALQEAVAEVTQLEGYELKRIMRTGTVATIDNRNWELRDQSGPVQRLSQSRAIALDMESATIAANGFRFRVPYGTLLCVSDKPLHGELKLPGMATTSTRRQVSRHLQIGIRAMDELRLRDMSAAVRPVLGNRGVKLKPGRTRNRVSGFRDRRLALSTGRGHRHGQTDRERRDCSGLASHGRTSGTGGAFHQWAAIVLQLAPRCQSPRPCHSD
jgi:hypothetical protein